MPRHILTQRQIEYQAIERKQKKSLSEMMEVKHDYDEPFRTLLLDVYREDIRACERIKFKYDCAVRN